MAEITEVVDGVLKVTKTPPPTIETFEKKEVESKRAEAQTLVDHAEIDLDALKAEVAKLDAYLVEINKVVIPK